MEGRCKFCQLQVPDWEQLECGCCGVPLPCLAHKDTRHKDQDYGGVRDLDRGEHDDAGYFCDGVTVGNGNHEVRICPECAVNCDFCEMWVCKKCAEACARV